MGRRLSASLFFSLAPWDTQHLPYVNFAFHLLEIEFSTHIMVEAQLAHASVR